MEMLYLENLRENYCIRNSFDEKHNTGILLWSGSSSAGTWR